MNTALQTTSLSRVCESTECKAPNQITVFRDGVNTYELSESFNDASDLICVHNVVKLCKKKCVTQPLWSAKSVKVVSGNHIELLLWTKNDGFLVPEFQIFWTLMKHHRGNFAQPSEKIGQYVLIAE